MRSVGSATAARSRAGGLRPTPCTLPSGTMVNDGSFPAVSGESTDAVEHAVGSPHGDGPSGTTRAPGVPCSADVFRHTALKAASHGVRAIQDEQRTDVADDHPARVACNRTGLRIGVPIVRQPTDGLRSLLQQYLG